MCLLLAGGAGAAAAGSLPYAPALARCYDAILDARFDDAEAEIARACGPAPPETCGLMRVNALWWQIQLNPNDRSRDRAFESQIDAALDRISQWTAREPKRADAWFFLGAAYGLRVQFRVLRAERLAAARDGKRIKEALEKALALDPSLQDAYFGIGLYHYYAGIAPAILKVLAWLLALPGGDRVQGLQEMRRARDRGELLRGEADYQLALIDLWYEHNVAEALSLLERLRASYPHNPVFLAAIADVQNVYRHDHRASLDAWRALAALARDGRVAFPAMSEIRARIGIATELTALSQPGAAVDELRAVIAAKPAAPYGASALAWLRLGDAYDRLGQRDRARDAYQAAIAAAPGDDPDNIRAQARDAQRRRR